VNQTDRDRKKGWKSEQKTLARTSFPLPDAQLESLFDLVANSVDRMGCDHTRTFTEDWLDDNKIDAEPVLKWLEENGGFCDCEVAGNAMQHWEENR